jgi:hypothetical protein
MITTSIARFLVPAALLISPVAASAQTSSLTKVTQVAENNVAAPTSASAAMAAPAPVQAPVAEKKVCKLLPSSYSRMNKRACLTAKEWKQVEEDSQ